MIHGFESDPDVTVLRSHLYEGCVQEIHEDDGWFGAGLKGEPAVSDDGWAGFQFNLIADEDRPLLDLGALFWLLTEVVQLPGGHREMRERIRFRRIDDPPMDGA